MEELGQVQAIQPWKAPPPTGEERHRRQRHRDPREPEDTVELSTDEPKVEEQEPGP
ncbi:MAG: hypothetical protein IT207_04880 [Fimbriimonadaceae bacterium]|nr:hypothetical protein [Fimbriimonadaceae bacterium]